MLALCQLYNASLDNQYRVNNNYPLNGNLPEKKVSPVLARRAVSAAGPAAADRPRARRPAALQTTTDDDDRRQRAKQYWPIRRASKNIPSLTPYV